MTAAATRVLQALAWSERAAPTLPVPLDRIATLTLGNADLATRVLIELDRGGFVQAEPRSSCVGRLTPKGRVMVAAIVGGAA